MLCWICCARFESLNWREATLKIQNYTKPDFGDIGWQHMRMSSHSQALDPTIGIGGKRGKLEQDLNSLEGIARGRHSHGCEGAHSCLPSTTHSFHTSSAKKNFATNESHNPQNRLPLADPIRMQPWLSSLRWRDSPLRSKCRISSSQTSTSNLQEYVEVKLTPFIRIEDML